jgi:sulfatase modifying factor 1
MCAAADASYVCIMGIWGRYESRAWVLDVCLWSGALTLAACGGRTELLGGGSSGGASGSSASSTRGAAPSSSATGGSEPCAGVTCNTPPVATCKTATTVTTYTASGTCAAGTCSYVATDAGCGSNKQCGGAGLCSECRTDSSCGATCAACGGGTPKCKDLGTTSQCVGCLSDSDCSGATPSCNTATNACGPPSCAGLTATCGPSGNGDCCASSIVTGGTFDRDNDATYPATVSDFRLDTYEVTVGRFRRFVAAYSRTMIAAGAGANPNNASDTGWSTAWNTSLDASSGALTTALKCNAPHQSWTDTAGSATAESLPINCLNWFEAEAFCIWDGGRLPTEAEWNYAAAGGTQQRVYPWGSAAPDCSHANFYGAGGKDYCVAPGTGAVNRVGSESPKGDGLYGQGDLAGNVAEWVQDWYIAYSGRT